MKDQGFMAYLLTQDRKAIATADKLDRGVRMLRRAGYPLDTFATDVRRADGEARSWLANTLEQRGVHAYNLEARALAAWARFHGHDHPGWRTQPSPPGLPKALDATETRLVLDPARALRDRAVALYALATGARRGEVAALRRADIDEPNRLVAIRHPSKRGPPRWIPPHPRLWEPEGAFMRYLEGAKTDVVWRDWFEPWTALSAQRLGTVAFLTSQELGFAFNFHRTRHTRATELLEAGVDIRYIQVYLGHSKLETTARYAEVRDAKMIGAIRSADARRPPAPLTRAEKRLSAWLTV